MTNTAARNYNTIEATEIVKNRIREHIREKEAVKGRLRRAIKFLFSCDDCSFNSADILGCFCLRNTDRITAARNRAADVFFPEVCVKSVDTDNTFYTAVVNLLQCVVEGIARSVLFTFCDSVFQVKHD